MNAPAVPLAPYKSTPPSRLLASALLAFALLLPPSFALAQSKKGPSAPAMSDADKAKAVDRRNYEKDTDEAYKKSLERIPDAPKADPWGGVREVPKK